MKAVRTITDAVSEEKVYQIALSMVPLVGGTTARQLISHCGSAAAVFSSKTHHLQRIPGIGQKIIHSIKNSQVLERAQQEVEQCRQKGIDIIAYTDPGFPLRLQQIYDAPVVFYYKGTASLEHPRMISIVGTRRATAYGKKVLEELLAALAPYQVVVVSELAYGIDIITHRMALAHGLPTIGVMASGMDIIYPAVHRKEAVDMLQHGGLLTEQPLGCKPDARKFPARNRLIAGLSDATLVIEAAESGGALITASFANEYDREVFAVPGSLHQPYSRGCNQLIRDHKAHILTKADDLIKMMNWDMDQPKSASQVVQHNKQRIESLSLDRQERSVAELLIESGEGLMMDEISWQTHIPVYQLASVLLQMEFKGLVKAYPGRKFKIMSEQLAVL